MMNEIILQSILTKINSLQKENQITQAMIKSLNKKLDPKIQINIKTSTGFIINTSNFPLGPQQLTKNNLRQTNNINNTMSNNSQNLNKKFENSIKNKKKHRNSFLLIYKHSMID